MPFTGAQQELFNHYSITTRSNAGENMIYEAIYRKQKIKDYVGNPLIEALPPIRTEDDWLDVLENVPEFKDTWLHEDKSIRNNLLMRLRDGYFPLRRHVELAIRIDQIIRDGYRSRNPSSRARGKLLQSAYEDMQKGMNVGCQFQALFSTRSISLIGISGSGKTTTTERIINSYPQVINHAEQGIIQVVWLKVDCPKDGSFKQLGKDIVGELDRILGTQFLKELPSKCSDTDIIRKIRELSAAYSLGLLVIDELQNLSVKKSGGREEMMNFFQEICNTVHVPVMLIGTMKASKILQLDFRHARRAAGVGSFVWDVMRNDEEWAFLVEELWNCQLLKNKHQLDQAMTDYLYAETQGIVGILTAAFLLAQLRAISSGEEALSEDLFTRVFKKDLDPVRKMLLALKSKDPNRIAKYEDVISPVIYEALEKEQTKMNAAQRKKPSQRRIKTIHEQALDELILMGQPKDLAQHILDEVTDGSEKTSQQLVRKSLFKLYKVERIDESDPDDLRELGA
ncbi:MAG: ATP-binding protein [Sedimenticola sp.]